MAEQVGEIYFEVNADTDQLMGSVSAVNSSTSRMAKSFKELDRALGKADSDAAALAAQFGGTGKAAAALENEIRRLGGQILENGNVVDRYGVRNAKMTHTLGALRGATFQTTRGFRMMRGGMQQIGYQVQDVAVQLQMGQNALMVLGQQGSQVASLFGAGGALFGAVLAITAALGTALVPSLFDSTTALERMEKALESMRKVAEVTDDGVVKLKDEIVELAKESLELAEARLRSALRENQSFLNESLTSVQEAFEAIGDVDIDLSVLDKEVGRASMTARDMLDSTRVNVTAQLRQIGQSFGLSGKDAIAFGRQVVEAYKMIGDEPTPESLKQFVVQMTQLEESSENLSSAASDTINSLIDMAEKAIEAGKSSAELREILKDIPAYLERMSKGSSDSSEELEKLIESLQREADTIGMNERKIAKYTAKKLLAADATQEEKEAVLAEIDALYDRIDAGQALINQQKSEEARLKAAQGEWERFGEKIESAFTKFQTTDEQREAVMNQIARIGIAAGKSAQQIMFLMAQQQALWNMEDQEGGDKIDPLLNRGFGSIEEYDIEKQRQEELLALEREFKEQKLADEREYVAQRIAINKEADEKIAKLNETASGIDWESFGNRAVGALTSVAVGAQSGREAMRGLAISIAQEAIGELIRMAFTSSALKKKETAEGVASATALTSAYAPAAAAASVATAGGAATSGLTAMAATIPMMMGMLLSGGRKYGGAVDAGRMYEVNETGRPEMFVSGNRSYLMPTSNGEVISNREMTSGGQQAAPIININNYSSERATATTRTEGNGLNARQVIDVVVGDMERRGRVHSAITRTTNAVNRNRGA